ncbi:hypothetical protein C7271_02065 [filamentous cyanobacterium CCP5]|nr:hypothetical protein C7271_02065 [filamentous cyanobacterium CCP5]
MYFGVYQVIKKAFEGETLQSVEAKLEDCSHWALSESKQVTTHLTLSLKEWNDCLRQLQAVSSPSNALKHLTLTAQMALDPNSDRKIHDSLESSLDPDPDINIHDSLESYLITKKGMNRELEETTLETEVDTTTSSEVRDSELGETPTKVEHDESTVIALNASENEVCNQTHATPEEGADKLAPSTLAPEPEFTSTIKSHPRSSNSETPRIALASSTPNQVAIPNQTMGFSFDALIDDFHHKKELEEEKGTQSKIWRGSGRSMEPTEHIRTFVDNG